MATHQAVHSGWATIPHFDHRACVHASMRGGLGSRAFTLGCRHGDSPEEQRCPVGSRSPQDTVPCTWATSRRWCHHRCRQDKASMQGIQQSCTCLIGTAKCQCVPTCVTQVGWHEDSRPRVTCAHRQVPGFMQVVTAPSMHVPAGHSDAVGDVDPAMQKYPAVQLPVHVGLVIPAVPP